VIFKTPGSDAFLPYFRAVCRNVARDALRRLRQNWHTGSLENSTQLRLALSNRLRPEQLARAEQLKRELLATLDSEDQQLFRLLIEGYSCPKFQAG